MDKELAEFVARIAFKNSSELSKLIPFLKDRLDQDEYEEYAKAIAKITGLVGTEILLKIFEEHPDIDERFKGTIQKYGRLP